VSNPGEPRFRHVGFFFRPLSARSVSHVGTQNALFQAEIADEQGHAQFLADKIAALGGEPTTEPRPVPYANLPREMLAEALAAEEQAIADYSERIQQAEVFGDLGLKVELENLVADETRHKEELERIISGWDER
jgi:bacterioferritin